MKDIRGVLLLVCILSLVVVGPGWCEGANETAPSMTAPYEDAPYDDAPNEYSTYEDATEADAPASAEPEVTEPPCDSEKPSSSAPGKKSGQGLAMKEQRLAERDARKAEQKRRQAERKQARQAKKEQRPATQPAAKKAGSSVANPEEAMLGDACEESVTRNKLPKGKPDRGEPCETDEECEEESSCGGETAFAFGNKTFIELGLTTGRWGWQLTVPVGADGTTPIYAGAGQNDIAKATRVGDLRYSYDGKVLSLNIELSGWTMSVTQIYAGNKDVPTIAPGKYGHIHEGLDGATSGSYRIEIEDEDGDGEIRIVVHADVFPN
jgi:hypothetical protein